MNNLSENFRVTEFECKCGCGLNIIQHETVIRSQLYCNHLNSRAIITSGTRCKKHNKEIGGVENSLHLCGWASDMEFIDIHIQTVYCKAYEIWLQFDYGGLIFYDWGIHQDIGRKRFEDRRQLYREVNYL